MPIPGHDFALRIVFIPVPAMNASPMSMTSDTGGCRGWVQHAGRSPSSAAGIAAYRPKTVHGIRFRFAAATARRAAAIAGLGAGPAPGTIYGIGKRRSIGLARDCPPNKPKCRGAS